jgi:hypothetical protein
MSIERRGLENLKTGMGVMNAHRNRTPAVALLELSMFANERQRLGMEMRRAEQRIREIAQRLEAIAAKGERLQRFVERYPDPKTGDIVAKHPRSSLPLHIAPSGMERRRVLTY